VGDTVKDIKRRGRGRNLVLSRDIAVRYVRATGSVVCLLTAMTFWRVADAGAAEPRNVKLAAGIGALNVLSQNWNDDEASWFYNVAQGSKLIPYTWFLNLEQPEAQTLFRDDDYIRSLGYLPRSPESRGNPDGLPIGFVKDGKHLGLTCAACHTTQINYQGRAWLVDGGPTLGDIVKFQTRLADSLDKTLYNAPKFDRFAQAVLGNASDAAKAGLKTKLKQVLATRRGYNTRNAPAPWAAEFGPGRVDAFGAILNEVTAAIAQVPDNYSPANAPVSYPFLWDTPQHDFVQWNGSAENKDVLFLKPILGTAHIGALGRNAGEVIGVFGTVDATREGSLLEFHGYQSSVNKENLIAIEESLRKLWSPKWPKELPPIDSELRDLGATLFEKNCSSCHKSIQRDDPERTVIAQMQAVGTDQTMASNFATRVAKSGVFQGRIASATDLRLFGPVEPVKDLLVHTVQRVLLWRPPGLVLPFTPDELLAPPPMGIDNPVYAEITVGNVKLAGAFTGLKFVDGKVQRTVSHDPLRLIDAQNNRFRQDFRALVRRFISADGQVKQLEQLSGIQFNVVPEGTETIFAEPVPIQFSYKARPLNGIWATAPYLHNASVPNLDELLKPSAKRIKSFRVGSREFDAVNVGFRVNEGDFEFDTTLPGNSNLGHDYAREFTDDERKQLIEYLKSL
jgi:hypothetical protein